jgi:hypothetical protein
MTPASIGNTDITTEGPAAMKIPAMVVLIAVMVGVTGAGRDVAAQESRRRSLRGLQGVEVVVEDMTSMANRYGLTRPQVQTDVEFRLHRAGIRVLTPDEVDSSPGGSHLYININTVFGDGPAAGLVP